MTQRIDRIVIEPPIPVITPEELTAIARIVPGDQETGLMPGYIAAAQEKVEMDTGVWLIIQPLLVKIAGAPDGGWPRSWLLPTPLQEIRAVRWYDTAGQVHVVDPTWYRASVDRIVWVRHVLSFMAPALWEIEVRAGYTPETIPPSLKFAVGLLAAHYLTTGRDLAVVGAAVQDMPMGYADAIAPFQVVAVI